MRKIGYVPIFLVLLHANAQAQECLMNPYDPQVEARLAPDARSVVLAKGEERCRVALDCTVRGEPKGFRYELATLANRRNPPTASLMRGITFDLADGTTQACRALGTHVLD